MSKKTSSYRLNVFAVVCGVCLAGAVSAGAVEPAEVTLAGDWQVKVTAKTPSPVTATIEVSRPDIITVTAEKYDKVPNVDPTRNNWRKGIALAGLKAAECTVKGAMDTASLVIRDGEGDAAVTFEKGRDYDADLDWGAIARLPNGRIKADQPVFISYKYAQMRIDSVVLSSDKKIVLKKGEPNTSMPQVPALDKGETRLANIFISGPLAKLTPDNLFVILETAYPEPAKPVPSIAEARLPKTMKKLKSGEPLKILAWGDSVTTFKLWQTMFVERLQAKFPNAKIELVTEAWGGRNTDTYLAEPPGSIHNYKEKVLAQKPDLIAMEFVNDGGKSQARVEELYSKLLADFQAIGAEWVILSPHYIRPDMMKLTSQKDIDDDPRDYVKGLRLFCEKHNVALADASLRYGRLWRQGIPYLTLMDNNINHPNVFGHSLFADSLIALFP